MPGQESCVRCRSRLAASGAGAPGDFSPPRAGPLKSFRFLSHAGNRVLDRLSRYAPDWLFWIAGVDIMPDRDRAAVFLSIAPGLGHLAYGRKRAAAIAALVWLAAVGLAVNFYSGWRGGALLAFLITWHAFVTFHAGRIHRNAGGAFTRIRGMLAIVLASAVGYLLIDRLVHRYVDLVAVPYALPEMDLRIGDVLIVRRGRYAVPNLRRGDLLTVNTGERRLVRVGFEVYADIRLQGDMPARVLALPGDKVTISKDRTTVNDEPTALPKTPLGFIPLPDRTLTVRVPTKHAMVVFPLQPGLAGHSQQIAELAWTDLFVVDLSLVNGRAAGVYLPLSRRRLFGRDAGP